MVKFPELQQKCVNPLPSMHNARVYIPFSSLFFGSNTFLGFFPAFSFPDFFGSNISWFDFTPVSFLFLAPIRSFASSLPFSLPNQCAKRSSIDDLVLMRTKLLKWSSFYTKGLFFPKYDIWWDLKVCSSTINEEIYRVSFLTGPAQKSSKYGTGPTQQQKSN